MQTWYEVKVRYVKVDHDGREKKVTEAYLFDSVSFSDAESRATAEFQQVIRGEFSIENIRKTNVLEIFNQGGQYWYKGSISIVTIDEHAGKEKKVKNYFMVAADDFDEANKVLAEGLSYILVPYEITSMTVTNILDVFPYFKNEEVAIDPVEVWKASETDMGDDVKNTTIEEDEEDTEYQDGEDPFEALL